MALFITSRIRVDWIGIASIMNSELHKVIPIRLGSWTCVSALSESQTITRAISSDVSK